MLETLNRIQMNNLLSSQRIGRIACTDGSRPYVVPVTYSYDGKYIYGQSTEGMNISILRKHPDVCFEVDQLQNLGNWQSVNVLGKFEELENAEAQKARDLLQRHLFPLMTDYIVHGYGHAVETPATADELPVIYRIRIRTMTGTAEKH